MWVTVRFLLTYKPHFPRLNLKRYSAQTRRPIRPFACGCRRTSAHARPPRSLRRSARLSLGSVTLCMCTSACMCKCACVDTRVGLTMRACACTYARALWQLLIVVNLTVCVCLMRGYVLITVLTFAYMRCVPFYIYINNSPTYWLYYFHHHVISIIMLFPSSIISNFHKIIAFWLCYFPSCRDIKEHVLLVEQQFGLFEGVEAHEVETL